MYEHSLSFLYILLFKDLYILIVIFLIRIMDEDDDEDPNYTTVFSIS